MRNFIIVIIVLAVLIGGALALTHKSNNKAPVSQQATTSSPTKTPNNQPASNKPAPNTDQNAAATITYSDNGFSPASLTVKSGTPVTIKNTSSQDMQFDSDPHPVHTDDPELNVGLVSPGKSTTFTPTTKGSHGYHNHLDSSQTGTLIVD